MAFAQGVQLVRVLVAALTGFAVAAGAAGAGAPGSGPGGTPVGTPGIAPGLHRRLDGVGFVSPQEDDFFADYKDLVTPPKDLLETPKDLLETPKDLTDTPEDLVETPKDLVDSPKDLLDDHQSEDFGEYGQHGADGEAKKDREELEDHEDDRDTAALDELADLSLAQHLKNSDREPPYGEQEEESPKGASLYEPEDDPVPVKVTPDFYGQEVTSVADKKPSYYVPDVNSVVDKTASSYYGQHKHKPAYEHASSLRSPYEQAGFRSPYDHSDARAPYSQPAPTRRPVSTKAAAFKAPAFKTAVHPGYHGHHSSLRGGSHDSQELGGRLVRPEYAYRYGVHDPTTRDVKSAWEQRDGEDTRGGYALIEPNGHTRVVEYKVTKKGGFNAHVKHLPPGHRGRRAAAGEERRDLVPSM